MFSKNTLDTLSIYDVICKKEYQSHTASLRSLTIPAQNPAKTTLRIVLIYLAAAGAGLALLPFINLKTIELKQGHFHVLQDILFLCLTATLLFLLVYRLTTQLHQSNRLARQNERRYRSLFENMHEGGAVYHPVDQGQDFIFVDINCNGERIEQVNRQDLIGHRITEVFPETELLKVMQQVYSTSTPAHRPITRYKDKRLEAWRENYVFRLDSGDVVVVYDDITEKKQLQEKLLHSQAELTLRNKILTKFLTADDDTVYQLVLQLVLETLQSRVGFFGYMNEQGKLICPALIDNYKDRSITFSHESCEDLWEAALRDGKTVVRNSPLAVSDGLVTLKNGLAVPILYQDEKIGLLCIANKNEDYTDDDVSLLKHICSYLAPIINARLQTQYSEKLRSEAEMELAKSEFSLKEAEKVAKLGHWEHNFVNDTLSWSDEVYRIFSLDAKQFEASFQNFLDQVHPDDREFVYQAYSKSVADKTDYNITHRLLLADGTTKFIHEQCVTTYNEQDEPVHSLGTVQDITERVLAEESSRRLTTAISQTVDVIVITDTDGTIQYVNPAFEKLTGYSREEAVGQNSRLLQSGKQSAKFYQNLWNTVGNGRVWQGRFINKKKNGTLFTEEATITPVKDEAGQIINFVAVKHDISRELELERQLRQAVKMEAIGTLAGGIAHDFNNILGAILGYTKMAMDDLSKKSQPYRDLEKALQSGDRAAELVKQILLFSRRQEQAFIPVQLQFLIKEVVKMLRASLPASIVLKEEIEQNCPSVMADPTQIHQILMNLSTNAKQSMLGKGGTLTITLSRQKFDDAAELPSAELKPGEYVKLSIRDTGSGIAKDSLTRIFDPFFTTKGIGEGTGLGLAVVHGIVKSHNGAITVDSELQKGTTFTIFLPVPLLEDESALPQNDETIAEGTEHILVVDDETDILTIRKRVLADIGYRVTTFSSSIEALASFQEDPRQYDLLLTDMTMPDMDGKELTDNILAIRPDMPIIMCTGYSEIINEQRASEYGIHAFLSKPVKQATLAKTIRKVLDNGTNSGC